MPYLLCQFVNLCTFSFVFLSLPPSLSQTVLWFSVSINNYRVLMCTVSLYFFCSPSVRQIILWFSVPINIFSVLMCTVPFCLSLLSTNFFLPTRDTKPHPSPATPLFLSKPFLLLFPVSVCRCCL